MSGTALAIAVSPAENRLLSSVGRKPSPRHHAVDAEAAAEAVLGRASHVATRRATSRMSSRSASGGSQCVEMPA